MTTKLDKRIEQSDGEKRHYWLREDFDHLMKLLPVRDQKSHDCRESGSSLAYAKNIKGALGELRLRGLQCDESVLMHLVDQKVVRPKSDSSSPQWTKKNIDTAAEWLYEHQRWSSWTHFCWTCNLRYGQVVKAYRVAAARYDLRFSMSFEPLGLVTVIEPADSAEDYAWVRFFQSGAKVDPQEK